MNIKWTFISALRVILCGKVDCDRTRYVECMANKNNFIKVVPVKLSVDRIARKNSTAQGDAFVLTGEDYAGFFHDADQVISREVILISL